MQTATLFLADITCLDHAIIVPGALDKSGLPRLTGGSYMVSCYVTGPVDPHENVVMDFSNLKKFLKSELDSYERGYDHKLLVIPGTPGVSCDGTGSQLTISIPGMLIELPLSRVAFLRRSLPHLPVDYRTSLHKILENELSAFLTERAKVFGDVKVRVSLSQESPFLTSVERSRASAELGCVSVGFSYVHGLPRSTSLGCRNIAHGHRSTITVFSLYAGLELTTGLERIFDNAVFASKDSFDPATRTISYSAPGPAGEKPQAFKMQLSDDRYNLILLEKETTVENIAEYVRERVAALAPKGVHLIAVSEGLTKGAVIEVHP